MHLNMPAVTSYSGPAKERPWAHFQKFPTWNLGRQSGLNQQTSTNGDCRLIPNKWGAAAATSSPQCGIWGRIQTNEELQPAVPNMESKGWSSQSNEELLPKLLAVPNVEQVILDKCGLTGKSIRLGAWHKESLEPRGTYIWPSETAREMELKKAFAGTMLCLCFLLSSKAIPSLLQIPPWPPNLWNNKNLPK